MDYRSLYKWIEKHQSTLQLITIPLLLLMVAGVYLLVYMTGGLKYVYVHTMYIPILLAGIICGIKGGIFIGSLAGLIVGPLMPLDISTGEAQKTFSWLYRCGIFTLTGFLCGVASDTIRSYLRYINWLSRHDLPSNLPNRQAVIEQLEQISENHADAADAHIVAIISIENNRELLSTFGVTILDQAMVQLHKRLQEKKSQILSIFRLNSAQLALLIGDISDHDEKRFFDKLSASFREPILFEEIPIHIDVRIGYVPLSGPQVAPELQLQKAQSALTEACYRASDHVGFSQAISTASRENLVMLGELKEALTKKQLSLHYQPKVDIATGAVHSVEALIRWQHPQKGNIPPGIFIPRAEESTLINQITYFVLERAMTQMVLWQQAGINITVAVNISARNLLQPDFCNVVFCLLEHHGLSGEQLELEITEGALMLDAQRAIEELNRLANAKIVLSIDDFGTGYSSLQYLHQLPVSLIKIDQSFIRRLPADESATSIVETAISMAHKMSIKTIAEGIEERETYDFLEKIGCDMAQGYIISRPLPGDEYANWHKQYNRFCG
ncbi:putative bifunctional diguanylate cyclase/phosphodiesterase [Psychromonas sp.]|uniref:putative bifunctional diguanylate cyclase/phosphodiesterase n=1 Tax=Psychromonas sp. TaxID=1884585 RepID=UPI0035680DCF